MDEKRALHLAEGLITHDQALLECGDQVLPLARRLEGLVDRFTSYRLCPTGRGAD